MEKTNNHPLLRWDRVRSCGRFHSKPGGQLQVNDVPFPATLPLVLYAFRAISLLERKTEQEEPLRTTNTDQFLAEELSLRVSGVMSWEEFPQFLCNKLF